MTLRNSDVAELKRGGLKDFLAEMSEEDLLAALEAPGPSPSIFRPEAEIKSENVELPEGLELETNSRLTVIRMMEEVPELERPFTFYVRRFCGPSHVQGMRTVLSRGRKFARDEGYEVEPFRMQVLSIETRLECDVVTLTRVPKGKKIRNSLVGLAKLLGGSNVREEDEDEE